MITVFVILLVIFGINGNLIGLFERVTKNDLSKGPTWIFILFIFFGFLMFLFYKKIRQYRKEYDVEQEILEYDSWWGNICPPLRPKEDYLEKKRWLKLQKIQKKIKR